MESHEKLREGSHEKLKEGSHEKAEKYRRLVTRRFFFSQFALLSL
jgi:hypothetical protein